MIKCSICLRSEGTEQIPGAFGAINACVGCADLIKAIRHELVSTGTLARMIASGAIEALAYLSEHTTICPACFDKIDPEYRSQYRATTIDAFNSCDFCGNDFGRLTP